MSRFEDRLKLLQPAPASDALRRSLAAGARPARLRWIPMAAAAAGLLAALAFVLTREPVRTSPTPAQEALGKIEETLRKARSLRVRFERDAEIVYPGGRRQKVHTAGTMLLREGNLLNFSFKENAIGTNTPETEFIIVSDGKAVKTFLRTKDVLKQIPGWGTGASSMLNDRFALALARESIAVPGNVIVLEKLEEVLAVSEIKQGEDDGALKTLIYKVGPFDARLWYDPKTSLPVKRTRENKDLGTFTETYPELTLNPELGDELFRAPEEKK